MRFGVLNHAELPWFTESQIIEYVPRGCIGDKPPGRPLGCRPKGNGGPGMLKTIRGEAVPALGLGTYQLTGPEGEAAIRSAIAELTLAGHIYKGKLPPPVLGETYTLEYGSATLEVPANGVELAGRSVVVIDDVLATGGTLAATHQLLTKAGAEVTGAVVMMELTALGGRAAVEPLEVTSLYTV